MLGQRANATGTSGQRVKSSCSSGARVCRKERRRGLSGGRLNACGPRYRGVRHGIQAAPAWNQKATLTSGRMRNGHANHAPSAGPSTERRTHITHSSRIGLRKGTAHASITRHLACHNFIAGFRVEYGNSGTGMHRGALSLRRKRTSPRPSPRASKRRAGLAGGPGRVTWGKGCLQYVSGQEPDSVQTRPWQRGLALFRPWWSVP